MEESIIKFAIIITNDFGVRIYSTHRTLKSAKSLFKKDIDGTKLDSYCKIVKIVETNDNR